MKISTPIRSRLETPNRAGPTRSGWRRNLAVAACAVGLAAGCSSTGDGGAPRPSGTAGTVPVEAAQSAFCQDVASFVGVIDRYGRVFT